MGIVFFQDPITDLIISFNYVISILISQIGIIFIRQWYNERKKQLKNDISLSYAVYFLFFSFGTFIYFYIIYHEMSSEIFDLFYTLSIIIRGLGIVIFSISIEFNLQKVAKTRYLFSYLTIGSLLSVTIFKNSAFFYQILDVFNIFQIMLPIIYIIYFIKNTFGEVKTKLQISIIGLIIIFINLFISSKKRLEIIENLSNFSPIVILLTKFITVLGILLFFYGFMGYSFSLESQCRNNLISLHIIDKKRNISIYHKDFLESEIKSENLFAGGISGIIKVVKEFTGSQKNLEIIHIENKIILIEIGDNIIATLIAKKNLLNARYVLKQIISKFEYYFWDILKDCNVVEFNEEIFKPMEMIVRNLIRI